MPVGITIDAGGSPAFEQLAALAAAVTTLLDAERAEAVDGAPFAYRSRWRQAGIEGAVTPFTPRSGA